MSTFTSVNLEILPIQLIAILLLPNERLCLPLRQKLLLSNLILLLLLFIAEGKEEAAEGGAHHDDLHVNHCHCCSLYGLIVIRLQEEFVFDDWGISSV